MQDYGLMPHVCAYSAAISSCEKGRQWQQALGILWVAQTHDVTPNVVTCTAAISACEKGGQWQHGLGLLEAGLNIRSLDSLAGWLSREFQGLPS